MRRQLFTMTAVAAVTIFSASCGGDKSSGIAERFADAASSVSDSEKGDFLKDKAGLAKAQASLLDMPKFKGQQVFVFQDIHFFGDGRITLELQDPAKPGNIDHYEYKGGSWSEATPVQISGSGDMKDNLTAMDDIKFESVATVYHNWNEQAKGVEGASAKPLDHIYFSLWVPGQERYWNSSFIEGTREKYNITFNLDGSVKEFKKS